MHVQRLTHLGICVSDLERSLRFYREVLGCKEVGRLAMEGRATETLTGIEGVKGRAIYLERDGWRLELMEFSAPGCTGSKTPRSLNQLGLTHLSLRVDDLDAVCARLEAAGGGLLPASRIGGAGSPVRVIMAHDPDGLLLELIEGPGDPNAVPGGPGYLAGS